MQTWNNPGTWEGRVGFNPWIHQHSAGAHAEEAVASVLGDPSWPWWVCLRMQVVPNDLGRASRLATPDPRIAKAIPGSTVFATRRLCLNVCYNLAMPCPAPNHPECIGWLGPRLFYERQEFTRINSIQCISAFAF